MDRRRQKTREAVFAALGRLLKQKSYHKITVQEIIDEANVGRTTFYAHFETKDDLLRELCEELFAHIVDSALDAAHTHGRYSDAPAPNSVFLHLFQHLEQDDRNVLELLCCKSSDLFLRYFKDSLNAMVRSWLSGASHGEWEDLPEDFLVNHISSTFVETVLWWLKNRRKQAPEELMRYFGTVLGPVVALKDEV